MNRTEPRLSDSELAMAAAQTDGRPPWCTRGVLVFFTRELNDVELNQQLAEGLLEAKFGGPPGEFQQRAEHFLRQMTPSNAVLGQYLSVRVSAVFAEWPELLPWMVERGFQPGNPQDERWILGPLVGSLARCFVVNLIAVGQAIDGVGDDAIRLVDESLDRAWSVLPKFWRAARRDVHSIAFHMNSEFSEAVDRLIGAGEMIALEGDSRGDVARREAWGDALSSLFERVEKDKPTDMGASISERVRAIQRDAHCEQVAREFKRGSASWSRTDARRADAHSSIALKRGARSSSAFQQALVSVCSVSTELERADLLSALTVVLDEPGERAIFDAAFVEGLSDASASRKLGMSDKTFTAHKQRVVRKLKRKAERLIGERVPIAT